MNRSKMENDAKDTHRRRRFINPETEIRSEVNVLGESHRIVEKNFETEIWMDGKKLPLNNMMQETLANVVLGFSKTLKGTDVAPEQVDVKVKRLTKPVKVDAHKYP